MSVIKPLISAHYREVDIMSANAVVAQEPNGVWRLSITEALDDYERCVTEVLASNAQKHPNRHFAAQRCQLTDEWVYLTYGETYEQIQHLGQALIDLGLNENKPLVILSGNDLDHLRLSLAAMHVGIPYAPISTAYSLLSKTHDRLKHIITTLQPGAIFTSDLESYAHAIAVINEISEQVPAVIHSGDSCQDETHYHSINTLLQIPVKTVHEHYEAIQPNTIAKFLFTSGSSSTPKAVITTHGMLCANQKMLLQTFPCFGQTPPVLVDWLPWSHTFGSSHNVGIAMFNGGTFYIDDGAPTESAFTRTLKNLKDVSPTTYLTVPKGWAALAEALQNSAELRESFLKNMQFFYFAGAGLSDDVWKKLDAITAAHCGKPIRMMSGMGMTETSPSSLFTTGPLCGGTYIGLPTPGCEVKLVPDNEKLELRIKGPHVMPGYWRGPTQEQPVFDEEGFYRTGDAVAFVDASQPELGLYFDGRISDDFKLSTGTFVNTGAIQTKAVLLGAPYVWDVVVCGANQNYLGLLVFLRMPESLALANSSEATMDLSALAQHPKVIAFFQDFLEKFNEGVTGSSKQIRFIRIMETPPSLDNHELTDKGSINQREVLRKRAAIINDLFSGNDKKSIWFNPKQKTTKEAK